MNTPTIPEPYRLRIQSFFGFSNVPFRKNMWAQQMFDSRSQRELLQGLHCLADLHGLGLAVGPSGSGKSITIRRFAYELDSARYHVVHFSMLPTTTIGFLRALNRALGLPMRMHATDLFDAAQRCLVSYADEHGPHPILILDDAEGLTAQVFDLIRRLTTWELDAEDRFSVLLTGTEDLLNTLRNPDLEPLRTRMSYSRSLRPFSIEDTRNYVAFHLKRSEGSPDLFSEDAIRRIFQASQGRPRLINQLALESLIQAAIEGKDHIDGSFVSGLLAAHPLYHTQPGGEK
jgi:type II secretory pathway predicted ATPase ExeA